MIFNTNTNELTFNKKEALAMIRFLSTAIENVFDHNGVSIFTLPMIEERNHMQFASKITFSVEEQKS